MRKSYSSNVSIFYRHSLLLQGLAWIGSLSFLGSSVAWAQTDPNPDTLGSSPTKEAVRSPRSEPEPVFIRRRAAPETSVRRRRAVSEPETSVRRRRAVSEPETVVRRRRAVSEPETVVRRRRFAPETVVVRRRRAIALEPQPIIVRRRLIPQRQQEQEVVEKPYKLSAPKLSIPTPPEEIRQSNRFSTEPQPAIAPTDNTDNYIDSTDYSIGATRTYEKPNSVVLSERSTGCRKVLQSGNGLANGLCSRTTRISSRNNSRLRQNTNVPRRILSEPDFVSRRRYIPRNINLNLISSRQRRERRLDSVNIGFVRLSSNGVSITNRRSRRSISASGDRPETLIAQKAIYKTPLGYSDPKFNPNINRENGNINLMFPLSIPAEITSLFGWRIHPITGNRRFHAGTDIGAPMGTPVLAAYTGQVAIADWMGGYGLAVVLQHSKTEETLYGHLSEVFVQPGQWVEQGTVIGKVGSTGNSTGPHLHFEKRELTPDGWVAVDPGTQLQSALGQLLKSLETAQTPPTTAKPGT